MTHLDLFTGIGGFHLAARWAGFDTVGFSEIEPYCCALLSQHWPLIHNYGDIRTADFSKLRGTIDVLSAGVPCQPASLAGKRRGEKDDRWLWLAVLDVVGSVKPAWLLLENPPGILSLDEFAGVLLRLESLGYQIRAFSVPTNSVGAKHRRQRVFIVANSESERCVWTGQTWNGERRSENGAQRMLWTCPDPGIYGGFNGLPNKSHRLKALGNAVVPQQAFPFLHAIAQVISRGRS